MTLTQLRQKAREAYAKANNPRLQINGGITLPHRDDVLDAVLLAALEYAESYHTKAADLIRAKAQWGRFDMESLEQHDEDATHFRSLIEEMKRADTD